MGNKTDKSIKMQPTKSNLEDDVGSILEQYSSRDICLFYQVLHRSPAYAPWSFKGRLQVI